MSSYFKSIILLILISISTQSYAAGMRIAVMDFKADGVPEATARRVSELIRTEMINSGEFIVIERKQMDMILKEQGFQKSGCTDETCAVEVGKLVSAEKILIGTVMKLGDKIIINGRIVDVEKGIAEIGEREEAATMTELADASVDFTRNLTTRMYGLASMSPGESSMKGKISPDQKKKDELALRAGLLSALPFWSGSIGNNTLAGVAFVGIKLATLGFGIKYGIDYGSDHKDGDLAMFTLLAGAFLATTIVDVIYSYFSVGEQYSFFFGANDHPLMPGSVVIDVIPRFHVDYRTTACIRMPDGANLSMTRYF
ncbi:MAG: hypothetical protein CVV44_07815 [Spirochaetae bacterium HGW-Spirochaetae-1]|nr:MAG: hypothetical protein CVV44_07815 [Spirochaetae bacterium HGW-Spirochaetae-1]